MEPTCDVFLTNLPKNITDVVIRNLFSSAKVLKVKIIDDKKSENQKLCFVGFSTMDEALEAVRIADNSEAFGEPIRASISKKCLEGMENFQHRYNSKTNNSKQCNNSQVSPQPYTNVGRGRGLQTKIVNCQPSFKNEAVKLNDIKLKQKELIDVEIIDLSRTDLIFARPIKSTENSKIEITELLSKINASQSVLMPVDSPNVTNCYLAKWSDDCYYRAEILDILHDGSFKVTFVDEGTSNDIVTDIRHIPDGPLKQYPKQFLQLSLGCRDLEELKSFVMHESEGKLVKIYWLGKLALDSIPLVNLFLNEDEIIEKYIQINKNHIREKLLMKLDDLPIHQTGDNSNLIFSEAMFKNSQDFVLLLKNQNSITIKDKKSPCILPIPGDICIYEKRNSNLNQLFRCVIRRRQLFSFDIQLIDTGEQISNVNIDNLYTSEDSHKNEPPFAISCELAKDYDKDSLLKLLDNQDLKFNIIQYKKHNKYIVSFNIPVTKFYEYREINFKEFVGNGYKVSVSHSISPVNFYVQIDRDDYNKTLIDVQEKININYNGLSFKSMDEIKIKQAVVAPFIVSGTDAEYFRAKVLEKHSNLPQVHVLFIDYGNDEWVHIDKLLNVDENLVAKPGLALHCQLNIDINKEAYGHATDLFYQLVGFADNDSPEFVMQVICINENKFVVDLISQIKGSLTSVLEKSGTCIPKINEITLCKPITNGDRKLPKEKCSEVNSPNKTAESNGTNCPRYSLEEMTIKINNLEKRLLTLESCL